MKFQSLPPQKNQGFSLIVTVAMLVLMSVIAVGLLSLSTISIKSAAINSAEERARSNARMALMMAIDRLQYELGPDQRVSANGAVLRNMSVANPHWVGVWDSWIAGPLADANTNPNYPGSASEHRTIGSPSDNAMRPEYNRKDDYFRSWLVSMPNNYLGSIAVDLSSASTMPARSAAAIKLVAEGSLGDSALPADHVSVPLVGIADEDNRNVGRYAYWVSDQSQKASIMYDSYRAASTLTDAEQIYRTQAPAATGTNIATGLENVTIEERHASLPSHLTLDLLPNATGSPAQANLHSVTTRSTGVLADVREGGLKRDLSTILEQPIELADDGPEYMLYAFDDPRFPYLGNANDDNRANSRVPIQDLAAYYQLYDHQPTYGNNRRGGVHYSSSALSNTLQINTPDYDGGNKNQQMLIREYTSLYRRPVVTKVQFLVGFTAEPITQAERDWVKDIVDKQPWTTGKKTWYNNMDYIRDSDTHKMKLGIQPLVTLWNPYNIPLVMDNSLLLRYGSPPMGFRVRKYRATGDVYEYNWMNLGYANNAGTGTSAGQGGGPLISMRLAKNPVTFEPGEVKVFSIPSTTAANVAGDGQTLNLGETIMDSVNSWDPYGVFLMKNSAPVGHDHNCSPEVYWFNNENQSNQALVFNPDDKFTISIDHEREDIAGDRGEGRNASLNSEIAGAGFSLYLFDEGYLTGHYSTWADALRHDIMIGRHATKVDGFDAGVGAKRKELGAFYDELMRPGFPGGNSPIDFDSETNAIPGTQIIAAGQEG
ncbi:MAG TPA: hypothetical protein V6D20_06410, partial [Candidatus Obscuribacterales bacterium]